MQIDRRLSLGFDILVDPIDLPRREPNRIGHLLGRHVVILAIETGVHPLVGEREKELLLRLRHGVGVRGGPAAADRFGHAEVFGHAVNLGFVEVGNGLEVGRAVAILDEEPLVVLQPVGCAHHGVAQAVGVVVFHHLSHPLLEVRGGHDRLVGLQGEPCPPHLAVGQLDHQGENPVGGLAEEAGEHDLRFAARPVFGKHGTDRLVSPPVAAGRLEHRPHILHGRGDAEMVGQQLPQREAVVGGVVLGHENPKHPIGPHRAGTERRRHAAVDSARNPHHATLAAQSAAKLVANRLDNLFHRRGPVEIQRGERKRLLGYRRHAGVP